MKGKLAFFSAFCLERESSCRLWRAQSLIALFSVVEVGKAIYVVLAIEREKAGASLIGATTLSPHSNEIEIRLYLLKEKILKKNTNYFGNTQL